MSRLDFTKKWLETRELPKSIRCAAFFREIFGGSLKTKDFSRISSVPISSGPVYLSDSSAFRGDVESAILRPHLETGRVLIPASVLLDVHRLSESDQFLRANCLRYLHKSTKWHFVDFDFESTAFRSLDTSKTEYINAETRDIVLCCGLRLKELCKNTSIFTITTDRELQRIASRRGIIARAPRNGSSPLQHDERSICGKTAQFLLNREESFMNPRSRIK